MSTSKEFLDYVLEQLSPLGEIRTRPMMGEHVLYYRDKVVGGIYDNRLLVKATSGAQALLPDAPLDLPYEGAKLMLRIDELDDHSQLVALFAALYDELPTPQPRKRSKNA